MATKPIVPQGDTQVIEIRVRDASGPVSLSGATITWKLCSDEAANVAILTKTIGNGVSVLDEAGGKFAVMLEPADTATLPAGDYFHQARLVLPGDIVKTIVRQYLTVAETV